MSIYRSPLSQFEVTPLLSIQSPFLGHFSLTNLALYSVIVLILVLRLHIIIAPQLVPNQWSVGLESLYASLHGMVKEQIGSRNEVFLPFIYALFLFILFANLRGNVPYNFAVRTSAIVSLGLSFTIWFGCTILRLYLHGLHFFSYFVPKGTPLGMVPLLVLVELISFIARAFSLGIRLFRNLVAGHTLLKILSGFIYPAFTKGPLIRVFRLIPLALFTALIGLEIAVSFIQAYVFTILTCIYLKDAIDLH